MPMCLACRDWLAHSLLGPFAPFVFHTKEAKEEVRKQLICLQFQLKFDAKAEWEGNLLNILQLQNNSESPMRSITLTRILIILSLENLRNCKCKIFLVNLFQCLTILMVKKLHPIFD